MLMAVPFRIGRGIGQPEIRRQVDDLGRRRLREHLLQDLLRGGVRQRAEHKIEPELGPIEPIDGNQRRQVKR
jgi:hypothetical protein